MLDNFEKMDKLLNKNGFCIGTCSHREYTEDKQLYRFYLIINGCTVDITNRFYLDNNNKLIELIDIMVNNKLVTIKDNKELLVILRFLREFL